MHTSRNETEEAHKVSIRSFEHLLISNAANPRPKELSEELLHAFAIAAFESEGGKILKVNQTT